MCWISVLLGLAILYSRVTHDRLRVWTSRVLWGWMLVGWGLFTLSRASWTTRFWASTTPTQETTLSTGSLAVLYFAPVYNTTLDNPAGHWPLHAHFLLSGSLFAYVKAGLDPAPTRPGVRARLIFSASRSRRTR